MKTNKKAITKLFLCFALTLALVGATFSWVANNKTAKAAEAIAMDNKISIGYSSEDAWVQVDFDGFTVDWNSWHDADDFSLNNGVDPLAYTFVNGTSLRDQYNADNSICEVITETDWIEAYTILVNSNNYTVQLKAGFTLVGKDGNVYVLENDTAVDRKSVV